MIVGIPLYVIPWAILLFSVFGVLLWMTPDRGLAVARAAAMTALFTAAGALMYAISSDSPYVLDALGKAFGKIVLGE
jgi:hypothetical protein